MLHEEVNGGVKNHAPDNVRRDGMTFDNRDSTSKGFGRLEDSSSSITSSTDMACAPRAARAASSGLHLPHVRCQKTAIESYTPFRRATLSLLIRFIDKLLRGVLQCTSRI